MAYRSSTAYTTGIIYPFDVISADASSAITINGSSTITVAYGISGSIVITASATSSFLLTKNAESSSTISSSAVSSISLTKQIFGDGTIIPNQTGNAASTQILSGSGTITDTGISYTAGTLIFSGTGSVSGAGTASANIRPQQILSADGRTTALASAEIIQPFEYYLITPTIDEGLVEYDPYYNLIRNNVGVTVVKRDGTWQSVRNKVDGWLQECDVVFRGGHENKVNATQKAELEAAGYTVETRYL